MSAAATPAGAGAGAPRELPILAVLALLAALAIAALFQPRVQGDGWAYYLWLQALVRDGTTDLAPATERFSRFITYQAGERGPGRGHISLFPFGTALLWAPFDRLSFLVEGTASAALDARSREVQNDRYHRVLAVAIGSATYAVAAVLLTYLACRRVGGPGPALASCLFLFAGTPLLYYASREPTMSHAAATFAVALLAHLGMRWVGSGVASPGALRWLALGLVAGLAAVVRWQLLLLVLPLAVVAALRDCRRGLAAFLLGVALLFWTVPAMWLHMFGTPSPRAVGTVPSLWPWGYRLALYAPAHGLFTWAPVTALAVLGMVLLAALPGRRGLGLVLLAALGTQVYMTAATIDPTGGWCFGPRRLVELYPAFALGLAFLLERARRRSPALGGALIALAGVAVAFTMWLMVSYTAGLVHPGEGTVSDALARWRRGALPETLARVRAVELFAFDVGPPEPGPPWREGAD